ncbi:MAG: adenine deaminase [Saprospiraceae bacterium]|nr:adenine deaminase [Saprospiraceae bacterium]
MTIIAHLVDLHTRRIYPAEIRCENGTIRRIREISDAPPEAGFILPGFVDAHVHVESSMLPPSEFARMAVVHGTVATVSDPHEIANVLGSAGVEFMLDDARRAPFKFCFGAPSCVPATGFETAGATLDAAAVEDLLRRPDIGYLSEMMNFPGVLHGDPQVLAKIEAAKRLGKPVDGHAPGLRGEEARRYFEAGITTDHECFTYEEALEKARLGVRILIREGSAARNFEALWPLINEFPAQVMFCSDDKHPDDLLKGHINQLAARAVAKGCDVFDVLRAACLNPVEHYGLPVGQLREGDPADFTAVRDLVNFEVVNTWIDGALVASGGAAQMPYLPVATPNHFLAQPRQAADFHLKAKHATGLVRLIQVRDGEIVTDASEGRAHVQNGCLVPWHSQDVLKIVVLNRYAGRAPVAIGFVRGFGLQCGALASSVAHDSHNIVAVGCDDSAICAAVNAIIESKGGVSATDGQGDVRILPLPIAGLMSDRPGEQLAQDYAAIDAWVKSALGCVLRAPFMTLSFLALPVIPALKMTDLGLFDVQSFEFTDVELPLS